MTDQEVEVLVGVAGQNPQKDYSAGLDVDHLGDRRIGVMVAHHDVPPGLDPRPGGGVLQAGMG